MFRITITELNNDNRSDDTERYAQTVDRINLEGIIKAVNATPPPEPVKRKRRVDAGKPRAVNPSSEGAAQRKTVYTDTTGGAL